MKSIGRMTLTGVEDGRTAFRLRSGVHVMGAALGLLLASPTFAAIAVAAAVMVVSSPASGAGWSAQTSGTAQILHSVYFPFDAITGYAVGNNGTILKTTDGGANWTSQNSGTSNNFFSIHFPVDAHTGYAVASSGTIVKSTDCGTNWNTQTSNTTEHLYGVHFPVDATTGYAVGYNGTILKTTNGGTTWATQTSPTAVRLESVHFPADATTGYIVGLSGTILKTTNGGTTWNTQTSGTTVELRAVNFPVDATTGYAVGNIGTILKTTDGGTNWSVQSSGVTTQLYAVHFPVDATTGFATGSFNFTETVLKTTDGGITWGLLDAFVVDGITVYGIYFPVDATTGYAVGQDGTIVKTIDGGGIQTLLHPTGPSVSFNDFTNQTGCPGGHWDCVNDQAGNAGTGAPVSNDGNSSSLWDGNNQTNREMFRLDDGAIPAGSVVTKIEVRAWVGTGSGSAKKIKLSYQRIGTDADPVNGYLKTISTGGCCDELQTSSWSGLGWSTSDLDSLEIGILHADGGVVNVSQIYVRVSHHEPDYVLSDHGGGGQQPDAFTGAAGENDAELFGMNLDPGSDTISVTKLVFKITGIVGLADFDWTNIDLVEDENNDGNIDVGETTLVGGFGDVDQVAETITFWVSFDVKAATDYILRADFASLSGGDKVTIALNPTDITTTASAAGSTTAVTHHEGFTGGWMATGTYTGNSTGQSITGVGFQPQVVFVKKFPANKYGFVRTETMSGGLSKKIHYSNPLEADQIQTLDPDGFTVGSGLDVNTSGDACHWIAFGSAPGTLKVGSYPGTGVIQSICGVGFQPNVVMVFPDGATDVSCFRTSTMPDDTSAKFDTAPNGQLSSGSNWIKLLEPDGFQVGTNNKVNQSGITYHYVAFKTTADQVEVGSYPGDATNNHDIPVTFKPKYVIVYGDDPGLITPGGSHAIIHRPDSMVGNTSLNMSWGYAADTFVDTIKALEPTGFKVGSDITVNQFATTYHWMAFGASASAPPKPKIIKWVEVDPYGP